MMAGTDHEIEMMQAGMGRKARERNERHKTTMDHLNDAARYARIATITSFLACLFATASIIVGYVGQEQEQEEERSMKNAAQILEEVKRLIEPILDDTTIDKVVYRDVVGELADDMQSRWDAVNEELKAEGRE